MTLQEFSGLDKAQQHDIILQTGVKLGEKIQPDFKYEFYQVDHFYVELKLEQQGSLVGLQTFETFNQLEPYLQLMHVDTGGQENS